MLYDLGSRHATYGAKIDHFPIIGLINYINSTNKNFSKFHKTKIFSKKLSKKFFGKNWYPFFKKKKFFWKIFNWIYSYICIFIFIFIIGTALVETLKEALGDHWVDEVAEAWGNTLAYLKVHMSKGLENGKTENGRT